MDHLRNRRLLRAVECPKAELDQGDSTDSLSVPRLPLRPQFPSETVRRSLSLGRLNQGSGLWLGRNLLDRDHERSRSTDHAVATVKVEALNIRDEV
jgi:hypothetical protein